MSARQLSLKDHFVTQLGHSPTAGILLSVKGAPIHGRPQPVSMETRPIIGFQSTAIRRMAPTAKIARFILAPDRFVRASITTSVEGLALCAWPRSTFDVQESPI